MEAFARNHTPIEWVAPKVRKEDYVRPALRRMERAGQHGVYFILKSTLRFVHEAANVILQGPPDPVTFCTSSLHD